MPPVSRPLGQSALASARPPGRRPPCGVACAAPHPRPSPGYNRSPAQPGATGQHSPAHNTEAAAGRGAHGGGARPPGYPADCRYRGQLRRRPAETQAARPRQPPGEAPEGSGRPPGRRGRTTGRGAFRRPPASAGEVRGGPCSAAAQAPTTPHIPHRRGRLRPARPGPGVAAPRQGFNAGNRPPATTPPHVRAVALALASPALPPTSTWPASRWREPCSPACLT